MIKHWTPQELKALQRIRERFLNGTAGEADYWRVPEDVALYDSTFAERIGWKWNAVFGELQRRGWRPRSTRVLDWGCGSGIAHRRALAEWPQFVSLALHDRSPMARRFAEEKARTVFPGIAIAHGSPATTPETLLLISHVINELPPKELEALLELARGAGEVIWVEAGTHADSRRLIEVREVGRQRIEGTRIMVSAVLAQLQAIARQYADHIIPPLTSEFELDLFNTYRACLFPRHYPAHLSLRSDQRGELFEAVKSLHGGQCFLSTTRPGITRGNHYHHHKLERFLVVSGEALIRVRKLLTDDVAEFPVSGAAPAYVDMPALHTHSITNTGAGDLLTLFWSHEIFDPASPDTYPEAV